MLSHVTFTVSTDYESEPIQVHHLFVLKIAAYAGLPPAAQGHISTLAAADRYCLIYSYYICVEFSWYQRKSNPYNLMVKGF